MAQFVVRNLEDSVKAQLQRRARRNRRSMEEEVRDILRASVHQDATPATGLGSELAGLFAGIGLKSHLRELRGHKLTPPSFKP